MPAFLTKKQVYEWIRTGEKTIELRKGRPLNGDCIVFLNGQKQCVKGRILRRQEGALHEVLHAGTYRRIVPTAKNVDEALAFVRQIYPLTDGTFTAYEFQISK
jgi:ASC-1-like (ASCH) protein